MFLFVCLFVCLFVFKLEDGGCWGETEGVVLVFWEGICLPVCVCVM